MTDIKYTPEDIDRIFEERVSTEVFPAIIKKGVIVIWVFTYPNNEKFAGVEGSFPVNENNYSFSIGKEVCRKKIKNKLWELCGQYSIITGEKL